MGSLKEHQELVDRILLALSRTGKCRVWKQPTGVARPLSDPGSVVTFGLPGQADVSGLRCDGIRIELEVKTGKATQSKEQKNWGAMIVKFGGIYAVCRSENDALQAVFPDGTSLQAPPGMT